MGPEAMHVLLGVCCWVGLSCWFVGWVCLVVCPGWCVVSVPGCSGVIPVLVLWSLSCVSGWGLWGRGVWWRVAG